MIDLIEKIYQDGGSHPQHMVTPITKGISPSVLDNIDKNILPVLTYRTDYNGRPIVLKTPEGRIFLRIHPHYCSTGIHYGRIYQYYYLTDNSISAQFSLYVYDDMIITDKTLDKLYTVGESQMIIGDNHILELAPNLDISIYQKLINDGNVPAKEVGYFFKNGLAYKICQILSDEEYDELKYGIVIASDEEQLCQDRGMCFETSKGMVNCYEYKGQWKLGDGKEHLEDLYTYMGIGVENGWITIDFSDGHYGCPEYKLQPL